MNRTGQRLAKTIRSTQAAYCRKMIPILTARSAPAKFPGGSGGKVPNGDTRKCLSIFGQPGRAFITRLR